jgi:hypothetical protein
MPLYGITALHYAGRDIDEAMMGLLDSPDGKWAIEPAPSRLVEVVNRLVEGDTVITLFRSEDGTLVAGPEVKVTVVDGKNETLALAGEPPPGRRLSDLPVF